jgi:hypothetical protein
MISEIKSLRLTEVGRIRLSCFPDRVISNADSKMLEKVKTRFKEQKLTGIEFLSDDELVARYYTERLTGKPSTAIPFWLFMNYCYKYCKLKRIKVNTKAVDILLKQGNYPLDAEPTIKYVNAVTDLVQLSITT